MPETTKKSSKSSASSTKAKAKAKAPAKKTPAKKAPVKKAAASKAPAKKSPAKAAPAKKAAAKKAPAKKAAAKRPSRAASKRGSAANADHLIFGLEPYKPKKNEPYMSDDQLDHFREILTRWKHEVMEAVDRTIDRLRDDDETFPDSNDRATQETEFGLELRTRDRERKLVRKIDQALDRITHGEYGYCEITGEEIGLARLEARPIATKSVEAQERYEKAERHFNS